MTVETKSNVQMWAESIPTIIARRAQLEAERVQIEQTAPVDVDAVLARYAEIVQQEQAVKQLHYAWRERLRAARAQQT